MGLAQAAQHVAIELLEGFGVGAQQDVSVAEAELLCLFAELEAVGVATHGNVAFTPSEEHSRVDDEGQYKVDQHAAHHDEQALPGRFGTELPGLFGLFELFQVHRFVDHTSYLDIAAQGQPAYTIGGVAVLGLELEGGEPGVEEEAELFYTYFEELGKQKVSAFVQQNEQGETQD